MSNETTSAGEHHLERELDTGTDLRELLHKQQPFICSKSGGGQYNVILGFKSIHDMMDFHKQLIHFIDAKKQ